MHLILKKGNNINGLLGSMFCTYARRLCSKIKVLFRCNYCPPKGGPYGLHLRPLWGWLAGVQIR